MSFNRRFMGSQFLAMALLTGALPLPEEERQPEMSGALPNHQPLNQQDLADWWRIHQAEASKHESAPHQHSTLQASKVCRECGQKLSGAELREVRERQGKAAGRSRWDERQYLKRGA